MPTERSRCGSSIIVQQTSASLASPRITVGKVWELLQYAKKCRIVVEVDGVPISDAAPEQLRNALSSNVPSSAHLECAEDALGLSEYDYEESKFPRMQLKQNLSKLTKTEVQTALNETLFNGEHDAVDTHATPAGPNAKLPQTVEYEKTFIEEFYRFSGKPDAMGPAIDLQIEKKGEKKDEGSSKKARSDLDIVRRATKTEYEVFDQSLERILTRANLAGHLRRCATLCVTSKKCWALAFEREEEATGDSPRGTVRVFTVDHDDLDTLWGKWVQLARSDPYHILTADGPLLIQTLKSINYDIGYCKVQLLHSSSSQSRIYELSLPKVCQSQQGPVLGVEERPRFVIKVCLEALDFKTEVRALSQLIQSKEYNVNESYVLASFPYDSTSPLNMRHLFPESPKTPSIPNAWWQRCPDFEPSGALIMKIGTPVEYWSPSLGDALCAELHRVHRAGVLHCDVRVRSNVMLFDGKLRLIDFGMARFSSEPAMCQVDAKHVGIRLRGRLEGPVQWTEQDDLEMALVSLLKAMH